MKPRKQKLRLEDMIQVDPLTKKQEDVCKAFEKDYAVILNGSAGTGKTFLAMALALEEVLDKSTPYERVIVIRSIVPTRDIGFLPGDEDEKKLVYELPYRAIAADLFGEATAWDSLKEEHQVDFITTSFIRGLTIDRAVVIIDEMQNLDGHEIDSVVTRLGQDCKLLMCGDYYQSDFKRDNDKKGFVNFFKIAENLNKFKIVEFTWEDIVRSDFVRDYIMTKEMLKIQM